MNRQEVVDSILREKGEQPSEVGSAFAPSNIALSKYWGKRDVELNLPFTSSISVSLGHRGAFTSIELGERDEYWLNGRLVSKDSEFARRMHDYLNLFRKHGEHFVVRTKLNIPLSAGFASSACGFASLVLALNDLYGWQLSRRELSILARLGSGSACRSLHEGFVLWQAGVDADGWDSYGMPLEVVWPELCIGMLVIDSAPKAISSREAMLATVVSSPLYPRWVEQAAEDVQGIYNAIMQHNLVEMGEIAERNAMAMHAVIRSSVPPINYSSWETLQLIEQVQRIRQSGIPIYFTQDAGPNLQLIFASSQMEVLKQLFPNMEVVAPFADYHGQVERVDERQEYRSMGTMDKLLAHQRGDLHRAFSVMITRTNEDGEREVLLQQRSNNKYHSAGKWSNACCGHPLSYEGLLEEAKRRLAQELGVQLEGELREIGSFIYHANLGDGLVEHELDHVLWASCEEEELDLQPDSLEVQDYCWMSLERLQRQLLEEPERYSAWLPQVVAILLETKL